MAKTSIKQQLLKIKTKIKINIKTLIRLKTTKVLITPSSLPTEVEGGEVREVVIEDQSENLQVNLKVGLDSVTGAGILFPLKKLIICLEIVPTIHKIGRTFGQLNPIFTLTTLDPTCYYFSLGTLDGL